MNMKTKLLILLCLFITLSASAQRIKNLTTETTYNGNLMLSCDYSTYNVHHKIYLSTVTNYINGLSATRDTAIWTRLTTLENDTLWQPGSGTQSIQAIASADSALGDYSLSHGYQSWASILGSRAFSSGSGKAVTVDGWAQGIEFTAYSVATLGATDTMLIGTIDPIDIPNNYAIECSVKVLGVAYTGADKGLTYVGEYHFMIKQYGGTTTLAGLDTIAENIEAGFTGTFAPTADDTNERLILTVASSDAGAVFWSAIIIMNIIKFD